MATVQTNIVIYDVSGLRLTGTDWVNRLREEGVKAGAQERGRVRMVTHHGIERNDIEYALQVAEKLAKNMQTT